MSTDEAQSSLTDSSGGPSDNDDSGSSSMTKPNCTITERHDAMLDELADGNHFGTRSGALRQAIVTLYNQCDDDGTDPVLDEITRQLSDLPTRSDVKELVEEALSQQPTTAPMPAPRSSRNQPETDMTVQTESGSLEEVKNDVYAAMEDCGETSIPALADLTDHQVTEIRRALDLFMKDGWVAHDDDGGTTTYKLT